MEPTQELLTKLSRRRFLTDGISPEVALRSLVNDSKEQVSTKSRNHIELPEWAKTAAAAATGGHDRPSCERASLNGGSQHVHIPLSVLPQEAEMRAKPDRFRLRMAEVERDAAQRSFTQLEAEISAQNADLTDEINHLKRSAETLRQELVEARSEASADTLHSQGVASQECIRALQRDRDQFMLKARAESLTVERDKQSADMRMLEEQLRASQASLASIQDGLEDSPSPARCQTFKDSGLVDVATPQRWRGGAKAAPVASESCGMPTWPPASQVFRLDDVSPDRQGSGIAIEHSISRRQSRGLNDLEFGYDWGLELSSKMSIQRALQLAHWASAALGNKATLAASEPELAPPSEPAPKDVQPQELSDNFLELSASADAARGNGAGEAPEEDPYAAPLAELQDALALLQRASSSCGQQPSSETSTLEDDSFNMQIADLQRAVAILEELPSTPSPERQKATGAGDFTIEPSLVAVMQAKQRLLEAAAPPSAMDEAESTGSNNAEAEAITEECIVVQSEASTTVEIPPASPLDMIDRARVLQEMPLSRAFALKHLGNIAPSAQAHIWQKYAAKLQR